MADARGGDAAWLTTGSKVATLVGDWLGDLHYCDLTPLAYSGPDPRRCVMAFYSDCPSCVTGIHDGHVEHWGKRPEGANHLTSVHALVTALSEPRNLSTRHGAASSGKAVPARHPAPTMTRVCLWPIRPSGSGVTGGNGDRPRWDPRPGLEEYAEKATEPPCPSCDRDLSYPGDSPDAAATPTPSEPPTLPAARSATCAVPTVSTDDRRRLLGARLRRRPGRQ